MPCRWNRRSLPWLMALMMAFSASPASVLLSSEPTCRMGCAATASCCCKPADRQRQPNGTILEQRSARTACPEQCAAMAGSNPIGSATNLIARGVTEDTDAGITLPFEDRLAPGLTAVDADPRAPPASF